MLFKNKKGNTAMLQQLGLGIVFLAIIIGMGMIVLNSFGNSQGGDVNSTLQTIRGYLGTTNGGLASWIPVIIVIIVAFILISYFAGRGKSRY